MDRVEPKHDPRSIMAWPLRTELLTDRSRGVADWSGALHLGCPVRVTRPEIPGHPRARQRGVIRHVAPVVDLSPELSPALLWVRFDDGRTLPFWPNELTMLEDPYDDRD